MVDMVWILDFPFLSLLMDASVLFKVCHTQLFQRVGSMEADVDFIAPVVSHQVSCSVFPLAPLAALVNSS